MKRTGPSIDFLNLSRRAVDGEVMARLQVLPSELVRGVVEYF